MAMIAGVDMTQGSVADKAVYNGVIDEWQLLVEENQWVHSNSHVFLRLKPCWTLGM